MNKSRELFLLFPYAGEQVEGYTVIHKHTFLNDEPPYQMCSFWGVTSNYDLTKASNIALDEEWLVEEQYAFYLIRTADARSFISIMNVSEKEYLEDIFQMQVENNYEENENRISNSTITNICFTNRSKRRPKIKYMRNQPQLSN